MVNLFYLLSLLLSLLIHLDHPHHLFFFSLLLLFHLPFQFNESFNLCLFLHLMVSKLSSQHIQKLLFIPLVLNQLSNQSLLIVEVFLLDVFLL